MDTMHTLGEMEEGGVCMPVMMVGELTLTSMRRTHSTEMAATMYVTICRVITGRVVGAEGPSAFGAVMREVDPRREQ